MNPLGGPHNTSYPGEIEPAVQVFWSQRRAWHGDTVKIYVQAEFAKKNPDVEVKIMAKSAMRPIDTPSGKSLNDYTAGFSYDIKWQGPFGANREFELLVKVDGVLYSKGSPILYVDLDPPAFSM